MLGLTAGPVPLRVDVPVKAGLLDLIDHALEAGWSTRRACVLLGLDPDRAASWRTRACTGRLADLPCGGGAVHGLLESERAAIIELFEAWAGVDAPIASSRRAAPGWTWCTSRPRRCTGC